MEILEDDFIKIEDLYVAYRKAKVDAFYERDHATALDFANYEIRLTKNLRRLWQELTSEYPTWFRDYEFVGGFSFIPKALEPFDDDQPLKVRPAIISDPDASWRALAKLNRHKATFRMVGRHPVDYHVVSALWIQKVGHLYDSTLKPCAYANRVRRVAVREDRYHPPCKTTLGSFRPYSFGFRQWRSNGLSTMQEALKNQKSIIAVTADLKSFYHKVSAQYLLHPEFLRETGLELSQSQRIFTQQLITSIETWARNTPEHTDSPHIGLPVGISAPRLIANVIMQKFDRFVTRELSPLYYGRYVDDVFLVLENTHEFSNFEEVWDHIIKRSDGLVLKTERKGKIGYKINLPYSQESDLVFIGAKQKVFALDGTSGSSLLEAIMHTVTQRSSDWRMLPDLPTDEEDLAFEFLNAGRDATEEVDNLRKADGITVQRLGFALRLRNFEAVRRDLPPDQWKIHRERLYRIVLDHIITAPGIFAYAPYVARLISLAVSCNDFDRAAEFVRRVDKMFKLVERTADFHEVELQYAKQTVLHSCWISALKGLANFQQIYGKLDRFGLQTVLDAFSDVQIAEYSVARAERAALLLLQCDLGSDAYREIWIDGHDYAGRHKEPLANLPASVRRELYLDDARQFLRQASFSPGSEPKLDAGVNAIPRPIAFPTRPFTTAEISLLDQSTLTNWVQFRRWVRALRGRLFDKEIESKSPPLKNIEEIDKESIVFIPNSKGPRKPLVALPALATDDRSWKASVMGQPEPDGERYFRINRLINDALKCRPRPHYFVLPELSLPRRWFNLASHRLEHSGISLIAGLEYEHWSPPSHTGPNPFVSNQVRAALITDILGYQSLVYYQQEKQRPAPEEEKLLTQLASKSLRARMPVVRSIVQHEHFHFGILICSELTNIELRAKFRGFVDALVVPEWNQDINSFASLVEASAMDVHCFVVQVNNRNFGDCRVRAPYAASYLRDLVRVKGGVADYYVVAEIDVPGLRAFQSMAKAPDVDPLFKPKPDGFEMNPRRRELGEN